MGLENVRKQADPLDTGVKCRPDPLLPLCFPYPWPSFRGEGLFLSNPSVPQTCTRPSTHHAVRSAVGAWKAWSRVLTGEIKNANLF